MNELKPQKIAIFPSLSDEFKSEIGEKVEVEHTCKALFGRRFDIYTLSIIDGMMTAGELESATAHDKLVIEEALNQKCHLIEVLNGSGMKGGKDYLFDIDCIAWGSGVIDLPAEYINNLTGGAVKPNTLLEDAEFIKDINFEDILGIVKKAISEGIKEIIFK